MEASRPMSSSISFSLTMTVVRRSTASLSLQIEEGEVAVISLNSLRAGTGNEAETVSADSAEGVVGAVEKEGTGGPLLNTGDGVTSDVLGNLLLCRNDLGAAVEVEVEVAGIEVEVEVEVHSRGASNGTTSAMGMGV